MFNKFAERYLCAIYRMRQLKIHPMLDCRSSVDGRYLRRNATNLDPLAFMLEGAKWSGNCYIDFAEEYAIPPKAMLAFRIFLVGSDDSAFVRSNPVIGKELRSFGYGIYYCMRESYTDSRFYLDETDELDSKTKIKDLITNPGAALLKPADTISSIRDRKVEIEYTNRIW